MLVNQRLLMVAMMQLEKNKPIVAREFDKIGWEELSDPTYHKITKEQYEDLRLFINKNSNTEDDSQLSNFLRFGTFRSKEVIIPRNYVGVINIKNQIQIEILPKIDIDNDDKLKELFLKMLGSLRAFNHKSFKNAQLESSDLPIYEVFIRMYLNEVRDLLKKGLKSDYVTFEDNLPYFKGKFLVNQHLKHNLVRKERFYMAYDEFHLNRPENKLIKSTLLKLQGISTVAENVRMARQLLAEFELIEPSLHYDKDFSAVRLDRNSKDYQVLMTWSKVFLKNQSFSTFQGTTDVTALLFPMEKIFEAYVAQEIRKSFTAWTVETQKQSAYLFDEPRKFRLKPDIYMKYDKRAVVLDTKWKQLIANAQQNYGISQADMYQMYVYAYKYDVKDVVLLYPCHKDIDRFYLTEYQQNASSKPNLKKITIQIFAFDLTDVKGSLEELKELIASKGD